MTPLGRTAAPALVLALLLAAAGLAGCSEEQPGPGKPARALAAGLAAGKVRPVPFAGLRPAAAQARLAAATAGLAGVRPSVAVIAVREPAEDGVDARALLRWSWPIGGAGAPKDASGPGAEPWTYRTTARLVLRKNRWLVRWAPSLVEPSLKRGERLALSTLAPERGEVLGAGGQALVTARPVSRVGIDKTMVEAGDVESSALAVAEAVDVDPNAFAERVAKAGPKAFVEAIVLRVEALSALDPDQLEAIPGAVVLDDTLPLAPTRDFARPILGTVGAATAELVEASEGRLRAGDMTGLSGLQRRYDEVLRGRSGYVVRAVSTPDASAPGKQPRELARAEPAAGTAVTTTLDSGLQQTAETVLSRVKPASAIVAIRPSTGDVLAAASGPGGKGLATATVGRFAPGSTFKVVTSLALLRAGLTPSSTVPCTRNVTVDGRTFENYDDYPAGRIGAISLRSAVANSCNTAMISQNGKVSQAKLADAAAALGLGVDRDLGVPAFLGAVPLDAGETEHAASMIGQGKVEASPLAMATVAASVAHGTQVVPRLVTDPAPKAADDAGARVAEAGQLRGLMRAVVNEGSGRFLQDVPGGGVAAKTGTAEYGSDTPPRTHAWMIAVQGDLAVAVFVDDGASGSGTAGPLLERFLRERP